MVGSVGICARRGREGGYTLLFLAVTTAILGIVLAAALPLWSTAIQREKEAELQFRGMQYAEAIRIYQTRFGALPTSLDQLLERKPRSIRQLWKDPMTETGEWVMVRATPGGRAGRQLPGGRAPEGRRDTDPRSEAQRERDARRPEGETVGPIQGVRSSSEETSLAIFNEQESYDTWEFTVDLVPAPQTRPETGVVTRPRSDWVGRPFPEGLEPQQGQGPGGRPGDPTRPGSQTPGSQRGNRPQPRV